VTKDREIEDWMSDWQAATPPVPDVRGWIEKHHRRFVRENVGAFALFAAGLLAPLVIALRTSRAEIQLAWFGILLLYAGGLLFRIWNQRGTWRPVAQTTRAFLELSRRRALASRRALRVARWMAGLTSLVVAGMAAWIGPTMPAFAAGLVTGFAVALVPLSFFIARRRRRCERDLEEVRRLLSQFDA
jgi:hypothetical protein